MPGAACCRLYSLVCNIRTTRSTVARSNGKLIERRKSTTTLERLFLEATKTDEAKMQSNDEARKKK